jgi:serine/threonine-protein kinase
VAEPRLERIARALADGAPVDWPLEESSATTEELPLLQQLKLVAEIAASSRGPGPGDQWGPLRLVEPIGAGAFGDVFRAHDGRLQRDVALKLLRDGDAGGHVVAEARMLAQVRHRGVVTVHGADRIEGRTGIWMELVEGRTLEELLREHGPLDAKAATRIGAELASALAAVHGAGLVHRDVKAQNVMREPGGRVVLMDFGVGRPLQHAGARPAGTPLYMAPEVLAGKPATPRSDLYSLGVLLFHLVTREYPVGATSLEQVTQAHARGARRLLRDARPDLSESFVRVVDRALEQDPQRRFASAGELEQALLESARREGTVRSPWRWIAGAALFAGVALLVPWLHEHPPGPSPTPTATTTARTSPIAPSPSPTARAGRPKNDPFIAPLGGAPPGGGDSATPAPDVAYSIDARLEAAELRVRPSAAVHLYVLSLDDRDRPALVFPARGRLSDNPLAPAVETRVPVWGRRLVAVATLSRLGEFEAAVARQRVPVADLTTVPVHDAALERLAAALGFAPAATGRLLAAARPLSSHVEMLRGVWIRRLDASTR